MSLKRPFYHITVFLGLISMLIQANQKGPSPIRLKHFSMANGLPGETVRTVYQDSEGFIWMGIEAFGLCRFNGTQFEVFGHLPTDSSSLSSDFVEVIAEDRNGNLWIGSDFGINRFDKSLLAISQGTKFVRYFHHDNDPTSIAGNMINAILKDHQGVLWIGTSGGLNILNESTNNFRKYQLNQGSNANETLEVLAIYEDSRNNLWIGTNGGVFELSPQRKIINHWDKSSSQLTNNRVNAICEDKNGIIWLGSQRGIVLFDQKNNTFKHLLFENTVAKNIATAGINRLKTTKDGKMWIGTFSNGLMIYDVEDNSYLYLNTQDKNPEGMLSNQIREIIQDKQGIVWIAVKNNGLYLFDKRIETFELITETLDNQPGLSDKQVLSLYEDKSGILWIGTRLGGLNKFDPVSRKFTYCGYDRVNPKSIGSNRIEGITEDHLGIFWLSTVDGLIRFDRRSNHFEHFKFAPVRVVQEDENGQLWVGTKTGMFLFDKKNSSFVPFRTQKPDLPLNTPITCLIIDSYGKIWIGTYREGLMEYDPSTKELNWYKNDNKSPGSISNNMVRSIFEDANRRIWIGTKQNGFNLFDRKTKKFKVCNYQDGLPSNSVFSIIGDNSGNLWLATDKGISKFDPIKNKFTNFTSEYGLQGDVFVSGAACKTHDGKLYFGGDNGLNGFYPEKVEKPAFSAPVYITSVKCNESHIKEVNTHSPLLTFSYNDYLSFEFTLLNYSSPQKNVYAYKLKGLNNDWIYCNSRNYVSYANLFPGTYKFMVKGADIDGVWSAVPTEITFRILSPWWMSWQAIVSYILSGFTLVYLLLKMVRFKALKQNEVRLLKLEKEQTEKLSQFKIRFFTNISHEIRTPLTLLLPLVEKLITLNDLPKEAQSHLSLIKRNTFRLLNLVDELLEFRKIEQGQMKLKLKRADIIGFVRDITMPFDGIAKLKNIDFLIDSEYQSYEMLFDPGAVEKILSNLLSNAFKFTDTNGRIELSIRIVFATEKKWKVSMTAVGDEYLEIKVKDNGKGIAMESLPHIFERYYQGKTDDLINPNGIGIGLDLTKSMVDLHHSLIYVESCEGKGSVFTVLFPAEDKHYTKDSLSTSPLNAEKYIIDFNSALVSKFPENGNSFNELEKPQTNKYSILVIDDDQEVRELLKSILSDNYLIFTAIDGIEGKLMIDKHMPDLIVCDVMMPGINGIEFCNTIKSEFKTSHIPIILLSAGATVDHKIEGIESGADSYITKPFHTKQLKAEIANLINSRSKLKEHFRKDIYLQPTELNIPSVDEKFITNCIQVIELNLAESDFSVAELSRELGLSRTQLFRKLKALLGQTPLEFIYSTRLKIAARLLTEKHYQVSEVAYMTGFSSPASFSTSFRRYFGDSPSHYQQANIINT